MISLLVTSLSLLAQLSRVRQSQWQPIVELRTTIYLGTIRIKTFTLIDYLTCSPAVLCSLGLYFLAGRSLMALKVGAESCASSFCVAVSSYPSQTLPAKVPGHLPALSQLSVFQNPPWLAGFFLQSGLSPSPLWTPFFFLWLLLRNCPFWHPALLLASQFSLLNNVWLEAQHMIHFWTDESISWLFVNWRIPNVPLLVSPGVTKIYNYLVLVTPNR